MTTTAEAMHADVAEGTVCVKRVLIYGINYSPEVAGVGRYTGEIGAHFASSGHSVTVVTAPPHYPGWHVKPPHSPRRWSRERVGGAEVVRCPLFLARQVKGLARLVAPLSFALSSAPVALWHAVRQRPEVIIVIEPTLFVAPTALLAARLAGARTVLHVQDLEADAAFAVGHLRNSAAAAAAAAFEQLVLRGFDKVVTISDRMAERLVAKGVPSNRLEVVRNWVDTNAVRPLPTSLSYRRKLGLKEDDFVILYSGNLGAKQGVRVLIDAARLLAADDQVVVVVAGQGPMRSALEDAATKAANLRVLDFQPEPCLGEFMNVADVHVLPQERDAADLLLPSKLGGMLATGRPVIVTADPGTELANFLNGSCVLTPPGDADQLACAIRQIKRGVNIGRAQDRLRLAASLSKAPLIAKFTRAALFLQEPTNEPTSAFRAA